MDGNECMNLQMKEHVLKTFVTLLLVHMHQKRKIALEIAAKIANVSPNYTKFWPFRATGRTRC